jgi:very-short-patch-repair endonuclease
MNVDMDITYFLESPKGRCLEKHVRINFPDLYEALKSVPGGKYSEKIYRYFNPSVENKCVICGAPTKFKSIIVGYSRTCCVAHAAQDSERLSKIKQTTLERYGVENASQAESIKKKKEQTCLEHYGVKHIFSSPEVREKIKQTLQYKYGSENYSNRPLAEQTTLERYGVDNVFRLKEVWQKGYDARIKKGSYKKISKSNIERCIKRHDEIISISNGIFTCKCPHEGCNKCKNKTYDIPAGNFHTRKRFCIEPCTILQPIGQFNKNTNIERFIEEVLTECGIDVANRKEDRTILSGRGLDFYIPSHKLAIECNGCYWHSDVYKDKQYHYRKFKDCLDQGIQLISIWEDQVINSPEQVRNLIKAKLGLFNRTIRAHKCYIKEISSPEARTVLINHIQGPGSAKVRLGLYYKDELVTVMTFGKFRKCYGGSDDSWELIRYCVVPGTRVYGGASKLLKYFIEHYHPTKVTSFSSNDISTGALYKSLGFKKISNTISYWYIEPNTYKRHHRYIYRKSELVRMGGDPNKTEFELADELGLNRIYDSGQTKWELNLSPHCK